MIAAAGFMTEHSAACGLRRQENVMHADRRKEHPVATDNLRMQQV